MFQETFGASSDLVPLFRKVLDLCRVQANETVLVYSDHHSPRHYSTAFVRAAQDMGAQVFQIVVPTSQPEVLDGPIWDIWHSVAMVVDLESIMTSVYRPLRVSALESGTRVLRVTEPEDVLFRLAPKRSLRERVHAAAKLLQNGSTLRVVSPAGTDLSINVAGRSAFGLDGIVDQPGQWAHWSVAVVVGGANRSETNGRLVIDVGDILLAMQHYVTSRVTLTVEDGAITRIEGGVDAALLRQWFSAWNDPRAYFISHVGWGCDERADWGRMARKIPGGVGDAESFAGVFQIAFGRDTSWYIGGGTNDVPAHIDFNCLNHSIMLDGVPVSDHGRLVHSALAAG
jgi:2,5-dihydroxypyridine 5,6-dioxygenase